MPSLLYAYAERVSDFVCWNIKFITVFIISGSAMALSAAVAASGHSDEAKYITYVAALIDTLVVAFMGRLPTKSIYERFMNTYQRGPWTASVPMPTISTERKPRIQRMSNIMSSLDSTCEALIRKGKANKKVVYAWADSLAKISAELV